MDVIHFDEEYMDDSAESGPPAGPRVQPGLARQIAAEGIGTAFLLAAVVGSGIMGERLTGGNAAIALLANTLATGAALVALILTFGSISGAHFNPAVSLADAAVGGLRWRDVPGYLAAQMAGAFAGVAAAHAMFGMSVFSASRHARAGGAQFFSEFVATFGLLSVIWGVARTRTAAVPFAVAAFITAAYWFTASTSFANPAVTIARSATDTLAGIRPADVPGFVAAQLLGAGAATLLFRWLTPALPRRAPEVLLPDPSETEKPVSKSPEPVIFACVQNAGRSQMAAAFFNAFADPRKARALSAGTRPADGVHPEVVAAMREVGLDVSGVRPRRLTSDVAEGATLLVTMGCGDECPIVPGTARDDWPLDDPKGQPIERVREIREEIRRRVVALLAAHGWHR